MTSPRDDLSLSRVELVVLARLSSSRPPSERELAAAVLDLALPGESTARVREAVGEALAALRGRALMSEQRRVLTAEGGRALRSIFGLGRTPTWLEIRDAHLPALALGFEPGSRQATEALRETSSLAAAVLRAQLESDEASTPPALCDAMVTEALGLPPGPLTLARIRAHAIARRARIAARAVCAPHPDKKSMARALGRRWVHEATDPPGPRP